jgi:DNA-binding NtrC family response regulator
MPLTAAILAPTAPHRRAPADRRWPRAPDGGPGGAAGTRDIPRQGGARQPLPNDVCLLIVDDDPLMTDLLPRKLQRAMASGVRILTASNSTDAAQIIASQRPHVILSDFNLRETKTGLDVLAEAARAAPESARILFSGHTISEIGRPLRDADIHGYLEKPMRLDELVRPLLEAIRNATGLDLSREGGDGPR